MEEFKKLAKYVRGAYDEDEAFQVSSSPRLLPPTGRSSKSGVSGVLNMNGSVRATTLELGERASEDRRGRIRRRVSQALLRQSLSVVSDFETHVEQSPSSFSWLSHLRNSPP